MIVSHLYKSESSSKEKDSEHCRGDYFSGGEDLEDGRGEVGGGDELKVVLDDVQTRGYREREEISPAIHQLGSVKIRRHFIII